jgi:hypothetical protein
MSRLACLLSVAWLTGFLALPAPPALAQDRPPEAAADAPAHISFVDGSAILERDGSTETAPSSMPLLAGDRVRTQNGRVEVLFADGSTLHLDTNTRVDFQSDAVIRLLDGRIRLNIVGPTRRVEYRVDAPSAWVEVVSPGEYRVSVLGDARAPEVELAVLRGAADLVNDSGRTELSAGERAFARDNTRPSTPYVFNSAAWDQFDRWSESRRDARLGVSAEYLPDEVQSYAGTFNQYGSWQYMPTYGNVWYPHVSVSWRPYYYGRWNSFRPWGWTWIGTDPWAWPTHHYGRWGYNAGAWFWIPGRTWGPAWVSWAYAPGYVSWCPLGWNNRAVIGFDSNVNVYRGGYRYDPWNAWTVVPHRGFGSGLVNVNVVNGARIDTRTRGEFVVRNTAPDYRGYAVPRAAAPIRVAGTPAAGFSGNGGSRAASGSRIRTATPDADSSTAFRSRRGSSPPLSGSGYPAPARTPSDASTIPAPDRQGSIRSRDAGAATAPADGARFERRAVPRNDPNAANAPNVAPAAPSTPATPSRRVAPDARVTAPATQGNQPVIIESPDRSYRAESPDRNRAVPREPRENPMYSPSPTYGRSPERNPYRVPSAESPDPSPRATPRPSGDGGNGGAGVRSRPGPEHSAPAPSGPPPSAAPSRPSGPPQGAAPSNNSGNNGGNNSGNGGGGQSHSRGGGSSSGQAVPRGGRGN